MRRFSGVIAPVVTPFTEGGAIFEEGFANLMAYLADNGVHGVFAIGSYGAFPLMELEERKRATAYACRFALENGLQTIIQIGHASTDYAIELAKFAVDHGAHAVASVSPYYYSGHAYRESNLLNHFEKLVNAVAAPVQFYNNPRTTSFTPTADFVGKLIDLGLSGLKDSGSNMTLFGEMADVAWKKNPDFDLMPGSGSVMLPGMLMGASACVAGTSTAFPGLVSKLNNAIAAKNIDEAALLQQQVIRARLIQGKFGMRPAACYSIIRMRGYDVGRGRSPWLELTPVEYVKMEQLLRAENFLE